MKMKRTYNHSIFILLLLSLLWANNSFSQLKTYSFSQLDSLQTIEKRMVVVFIHTDWCSFCQAMKNTTLKNKNTIQILNDRFYFVQLNAEEKKDLVFHNKNYRFVPTGNKTGTHELTIELGTINNKLAFPSICILEPGNDIVFQQSSFYSAKELLQILEKMP